MCVDVVEYVVWVCEFWIDVLVCGCVCGFDVFVVEVVCELYLYDVDFVEIVVCDYFVCLFDYLVF